MNQLRQNTENSSSIRRRNNELLLQNMLIESSDNFERTFWYHQFIQKGTKKFDLTTIIPQSTCFHSVFGEKLKPQKRYFGIN